MQNRREFLKNSMALGGMAFLAPELGANASPTVAEPRFNEEYWGAIARQFSPTGDFINLESGYYSPMPLPVKEAYFKNIDYVNSLTSFYMRNQWDEDKARLKKIAGVNLGCSPSEFLFTRNTTESLNTVIMGIPLRAGDEIIISSQDYPSALVQWKFRARRDNLVLKVLDIRGLSDEAVLQLFESSITTRTKILHTTHMIHSTGRVLPVRSLSKMAHAHGLEVIVDAAHSINHIDYKIPDLESDYFMCSLHKWTCNPLGSGILYIHPSKLEKLAPLFAETEFAQNDIRKMERLGTLEPPVFLTLPTAFDFHNSIGGATKERRLHYLKNYWAERISKISAVQINTPLEPGKSGAIGNFTIRGKSNVEVQQRLFNQYRIFTAVTTDAPIQGIRVTVHLHTTLQQLDRFVDAITEISKS